VAELIKSLQELVEQNKDCAYVEVRWESGDGYVVGDAYVDSDDEGDPVVVIY